MKCSECNLEVEKAAKGKRCIGCYNRYMREYMNKRYHRLRAEYIKSMGGECVDCGETSNLEFDHLDSSQKSFDVGRILTHAKVKREQELAKCVLRCHDCHVIKSRREDWSTVDHGEGLTGKRNCYCDLCKPLKRVYMQNFKKSKILIP